MRIGGLALLIILILSYLYYVAWLFLKPFIEDEQYNIFPDQKYVYYIPSIFILLLLTTVMSTLAYILINSENFNKPITPPWVKYGYAQPKPF